MDLKKTPLHDYHVKSGARMAPFAGYDMPISYDPVTGGMLKEHLAVRNTAGIFDVSHMGEFWVTGPEATEFLNFACTRGFSALAESRAQYCLLLNEGGTIVDDIIVYKFSPQKYWVVVNASNIEKDFNHLKTLATKFRVELVDVSPKTALIALQGPKSLEIMKALYPDALALKYYNFYQPKAEWIVARTGYTGEDGFEVFLPSHEARSLWDACLKLGAQPIGLGARDTLRLEVGFPLYGHELSDQLTPPETCASFACDLTRDFHGAAAAKRVPKFRPVALSVQNSKPFRADERLFLDGKDVGWITSGSVSPIKKTGMALALVEVAKLPPSNPNPKVFVLETGGKQREAFVQDLPFVATARVKGKKV